MVWKTNVMGKDRLDSSAYFSLSQKIDQWNWKSKSLIAKKFIVTY